MVFFLSGLESRVDCCSCSDELHRHWPIEERSGVPQSPSLSQAARNLERRNVFVNTNKLPAFWNGEIQGPLKKVLLILINFFPDRQDNIFRVHITPLLPSLSYHVKYILYCWNLEPNLIFLGAEEGWHFVALSCVKCNMEHCMCKEYSTRTEIGLVRRQWNVCFVFIS
jgi:hypothetical protein